MVPCRIRFFGLEPTQFGRSRLRNLRLPEPAKKLAAPQQCKKVPKFKLPNSVPVLYYSFASFVEFVQLTRALGCRAKKGWYEVYGTDLEGRISRKSASDPSLPNDMRTKKGIYSKRPTIEIITKKDLDEEKNVQRFTTTESQSRLQNLRLPEPASNWRLRNNVKKYINLNCLNLFQYRVL